MTPDAIRRIAEEINRRAERTYAVGHCDGNNRCDLSRETLRDLKLTIPDIEALIREHLTTEETER